jgi:hypothetical protein
MLIIIIIIIWIANQGYICYGRYCKGSVLAPCTGGRLVIPTDQGPKATPRFLYQTETIPEPPCYVEDIYGCPLPPIDNRAISFEIQREALRLVDDFHDLDVDNNFDILDCLESPLMADMDPAIKDLIQNYLSKEERDDLKREILKHNQWISEFNVGAMACLGCNMAIYPMGLGVFIN